MFKLSIVIPVLGRLRLLENTLVSVLENRPEDCELLVVLNAPYDDPYDLAGEVRFIHARPRAGLVESLNCGIAASLAPVVHVLGCGVEVADGWAHTALRHFRDPSVGSVVPLVLDETARQRVIAAGISYHRGGKAEPAAAGQLEAVLKPAPIVGPSFLGGFYRKSALDVAGSHFDPHMGEHAADADLALRLQALGFRSVYEPAARLYAPPKPHRRRPRTFAAAAEAERLFLRHVPRGCWPGALVSHSGVVLAEFVRNLPRPAALVQLAGRATAWWQLARLRQQPEPAEASLPAGRHCDTELLRPHLHLASRRRSGSRL